MTRDEVRKLDNESYATSYNLRIQDYVNRESHVTRAFCGLEKPQEIGKDFWDANRSQIQFQKIQKKL
jgi:hypothetical protein